MTEFTKERLAELRAVAEAAESKHRAGVRATYTPLTPAETIALIDALEAKTAEVEELTEWREHVLEQVRGTTNLDHTGLLNSEQILDLDFGRLIDTLKRERDEAEAALERVREAATEVTNQGDNNGRTHYENCWKHHLHCLAAKIIYETEADDE